MPICYDLNETESNFFKFFKFMQSYNRLEFKQRNAQADLRDEYKTAQVTQNSMMQAMKYSIRLVDANSSPEKRFK